MTSTRVKLFSGVETRTVSLCGAAKKFTIEREPKPARLTNHDDGVDYVNNLEWETFCNDVDVAMKPLTKAVRFSEICLRVWMVCFFASHLVAIGSIQVLWGWEYLADLLLAIIFVPIVAFFLLGWTHSRYMRVVRKRVTEEIAEICEDRTTWTLHRGVSFRVAETAQEWYIHISINVELRLYPPQDHNRTIAMEVSTILTDPTSEELEELDEAHLEKSRAGSE